MIIKLYKSVLECSKPGCLNVPTIVLDSYNNRIRYTAGQAIVCEDHVPYGKGELARRFPGSEFQIRMSRSPGWLLREQREARQSAESEIPSVPPVEEKKTKPTTREDLIALMQGRLNDSGRRK